MTDKFFPWIQKQVAFCAQFTAGAPDPLAEATDSTKFVSVPCEVAPIDNPVGVFPNLQFSTQRYGTKQKPAVGGRDGAKFKLKLEGRRILDSYVPAVDTLSGAGSTLALLPPEFLLLAAALGSDNPIATTADLFNHGAHIPNQPYAAAKVIGASTTVIPVFAATAVNYGAGKLFLCGSGVSDSLLTRGFVKSQDVAADTVTLRRAAKNASVNLDNVYPTATAFMSQNPQIPMTFWVMGPDAKFRDSYVGCFCEKITMTITEGKPPVYEFDYVALSWNQYATTTAPTFAADFKQIDCLIGRNKTSLSIYKDTDGTPALVVDNIRNLKIEVDMKLSPIGDYNALEGVSTRYPEDCSVKLTFERPKVAAGQMDTLTGAADAWNLGLTAGQSFAIELYSGDGIGKQAAWSLPCMALQSHAKRALIGGELGQQLEFMAFPYGADVNDATVSAANGATAQAGLAVALG